MQQQKSRKVRVAGLAVAITLIMVLGSILISVPRISSAFPTIHPHSTDYYFYDGFNGTDGVTIAGTKDWTTPQAGVTFSMDLASSASTSAKFDVVGDGNNHILQHDFADDLNPATTGIIVECKFYDNASVTQQSPTVIASLSVGNANVNARLGLKLNISHAQRNYAIWGYDASFGGSGTLEQTTGVNRTTGWHDFKIYIASTTDLRFYVDNVFVGNLTYPEAQTLTYFNFYAPGGASVPAGTVWYVDDFFVYPFYQEKIWGPSQLAIRNNETWDSYYAVEPTVLYDQGLYRLWFDAGSTDIAAGHLGYATSVDGVHWSKATDILTMGTDTWRPYVTKVGTTYYLYYTNETGDYALKHYMVRTSLNGITWSAATDTNLGCSPGLSDWSHKLLGNIAVFKEGRTWYALYEAGSNATLWTIGLATSSDGITWTKYAGNPVMPSWFTGGNPEIHKLNGVYYMIAHGVLTNWVNNIPTDLYLFSSTDLRTWTPATFFTQMTRLFGYWGQNIQVADPTYYAGQGAQSGKYFLMFAGTLNETNQGRLYVSEGDYSLEDIARGQSLQYGYRIMQNPGMTNNITAGGKIWYSGLNAIKGIYNDNWSVSYPAATALRLTFNAWDPSTTATYGTAASWTVGAGASASLQIHHVIGGLTPGEHYQFSKNGGSLGVLYVPINGTVTLDSYGPGTFMVRLGNPGSLGLPASLHPFIVLILLFMCLVVAMPIIGLASMAKGKGVTKDDIIQAVIFSTIGLILIAILVRLLGS